MDLFLVFYVFPVFVGALCAAIAPWLVLRSKAVASNDVFAAFLVGLIASALCHTVLMVVIFGEFFVFGPGQYILPAIVYLIAFQMRKHQLQKKLDRAEKVP